MIEPIARIRIELQEIEPKVWRRVDVPLSSTLLALHDIIQLAFRWTDSHLFEFEIGDRIEMANPNTPSTTVMRMKGSTRRRTSG